jgi:hypothetical protein
MGERRGAYRVLIWKPEKKRPRGRPELHGRIILKCIFGIRWGHGLDRFGSGQGEVAGFCECGNEHSRFIKCGVCPE